MSTRKADAHSASNPITFVALFGRSSALFRKADGMPSDFDGE